MECVFTATAQPPHPWERPGTHCAAQGAGWVAGPVWTGKENLAGTRIRSPDRPTRSEALYRLRATNLLKRDATSQPYGCKIGYHKPSVTDS